MLISPDCHAEPPSISVTQPLSNLFLPLFFVFKERETRGMGQILSTRLFLCHLAECVAIFALPGDYTFLQGLPGLLKRSLLRHTGGWPIKLLRPLTMATQRGTVLLFYGGLLVYIFVLSRLFTQQHLWGFPPQTCGSRGACFVPLTERKAKIFQFWCDEMSGKNSLLALANNEKMKEIPQLSTTALTKTEFNVRPGFSHLCNRWKTWTGLKLRLSGSCRLLLPSLRPQRKPQTRPSSSIFTFFFFLSHHLLSSVADKVLPHW